MAIVQVTSREFREKQKDMFDLADKGERIIIRRGKKRSYILTPIDNPDFFLSPEAEERIELSRKQYLNGEFTTCKTAEEATKFLESL